MIVELLTFGNELLDGRRIDTNTAWIGKFLMGLGLEVRFRQTTQDRKGDIVDAFRIAMDRSDLIITTGGLGPTQDDITFESLSEAVMRPLEFHFDIWLQIQKKFEKRGLTCPESNKRQAHLPEGATPIKAVGTAPGCFLDVNGKWIFCFPGVPHEMQTMVEGFFSEKLKSKLQIKSIYQLGYSISGIAEALVEERIQQAGLQLHPDATLHVAYTASQSTVDVTFTITPNPAKKIEQIKNDIDSKFLELFQGSLIRWNDQPIEEHIVKMLEEKNWKLGIAESITGGLITSTLVNVPGCSNILERGVVTYSYPSKTDLLEVTESTLATKGAVSVECVLEMAQGLKKKSGVNVAVSICGIAGPGGATDSKPLGLTYICWLGPKFEMKNSKSVDSIKTRTYVKSTDFLKKVGPETQNAVMFRNRSSSMIEEHVFHGEQGTAVVQGFVFSGDRKRNRMLAANQALMGLHSFIKTFFDW
jgi:nicotinamide-nucleotide amidase